MASLATGKIDPDTHGVGLTDAPLEALRYDGQSDHPMEVAGMIRAMMPSGKRVLDVGCGTGSVTVIANHMRDNQVVAVEPDSQRAHVARSRGLDVYEGILDEEFLNTYGSFDVVMSSDVLEHTVSPADFLRAMVQAVKPGGLILISVPNVAHWSVRLNLLIGRFNYEPVGIMDATHLRWFTARSLKTLLEQCGLQIIEFSHTAGVTLPVYQRGLLRRVPGPFRRPVIRGLTRIFPRLFGVQHVVKARATLSDS